MSTTDNDATWEDVKAGDMGRSANTSMLDEENASF